MIQLFVNQMHRTAADLDALLERLALSVQSGERGKERGMNVQDAVLERPDEPGAHQPHVAGKADERYRALLELSGHLIVVLFARPCLVTDEEGFHPAPSASGNAGGGVDVADD